MQYYGIRSVSYMKTSPLKPDNMKKLLLFLLLPFMLGSCECDDASRTEIWTVASEKGVAGIASGFDVKSLSEILGHSDVTTTLRCYVHPSIEQKRRQMETLFDGKIRGRKYGQ